MTTRPFDQPADHPYIKHVTPEMTLRYATLASPALRSAYDQAIGKVRKVLPIAPAGQPVVPAKVDWIASEFLKTRVAHGYCSRHLAAGACPYAQHLRDLRQLRSRPRAPARPV